MEQEVWKDVLGFEGAYQISSMGRVKALPYYKTNGVSTYLRNEFMPKQYVDGRGYWVVGLSTRHLSIDRRHSVHRLLAIAFIPNPDNKPQVNHINGIKTDNRLENLEWCTNAENQLHSYRVLGRKATGQQDHPNIRSKKIIQLSTDGKVINEFYGYSEAERATGCNPSNVRKCCDGFRKTAYGYRWQYG